MCFAFAFAPQVVYILDQVRALEREMLKRIAAQGLGIIPQILVVTRLIPEAQVCCAPWPSCVPCRP